MARTFTSAMRLLDAADLFRNDIRIQLLFAVDRGSRFGSDALDALRTAGARMIHPALARRISFDLVMVASENTDVSGLQTPLVVVLPHGIGFHKMLADRQDRPEGRLTGVMPMGDADRPPTVLIVGHENQEEQLARAFGDAKPTSRLARDPIFEQLGWSHRLRNTYRAGFGVRSSERFIVLTSTWGDGSLMAQETTLPSTLLRNLPMDEYRIAAILHPNIWFGHGRLQVRSWLADAREAGLILIPPDRGWQAALISSDAVIGDHGSVTLYAAAAGMRVQLGAFAEREVVPKTAMATLGTLAARFVAGRDPRASVERLLMTPSIRDAIERETFGGEAVPSLIDVLYGLLDLTPPPRRPRVFPVPAITTSEVTSFFVSLTQQADDTLRYTRFPAAVGSESLQNGEQRDLGRLLVASDDEPDVRRWESASVLFKTGFETRRDAERWVTSTVDGRFVTSGAFADGTVTRIEGLDGLLISAALSGNRSAPTWLVAASIGARAVRAGTPAALLRSFELNPYEEVEIEPGWMCAIETRVSTRPA